MAGTNKIRMSIQGNQALVAHPSASTLFSKP
jgi:hypothetical protein